MKRSVLLASLATAVLVVGLDLSSAAATPVPTAARAAVADMATTPATAVHWHGHRGFHGFRGGFGLFLAAPYFGPRCWWSHRWHRRVCDYY